MLSYTGRIQLKIQDMGFWRELPAIVLWLYLNFRGYPTSVSEWLNPRRWWRLQRCLVICLCYIITPSGLFWAPLSLFIENLQTDALWFAIRMLRTAQKGTARTCSISVPADHQVVTILLIVIWFQVAIGYMYCCIHIKQPLGRKKHALQGFFDGISSLLSFGCIFIPRRRWWLPQTLIQYEALSMHCTLYDSIQS